MRLVLFERILQLHHRLGQAVACAHDVAAQPINQPLAGATSQRQGGGRIRRRRRLLTSSLERRLTRRLTIRWGGVRITYSANFLVMCLLVQSTAVQGGVRITDSAVDRRGPLACEQADQEADYAEACLLVHHA